MLPPVLRQRAEIAWQGHLADWKPSQVLSLAVTLLTRGQAASEGLLGKLPCMHPPSVVPRVAVEGC